LIRRCAGSKRDGSRCTATVNAPQTLCWWHDPAHAKQRSRAASKAGRAKPSKEIVNIRARLSDLADDVLAGRVDRADAAVAGQLLGTVIRAISAELKVKEQLLLEERLETLEKQLQEAREAQSAWR
jgi:LPS O-antigen subunit length determinant protein (WzzB/FepE family)